MGHRKLKVQDIIASIRTYKIHFGYGPTLEDLAAAKCVAKSTIHRYLTIMEKDGLISRFGRRARTIIILEDEKNDSLKTR